MAEVTILMPVHNAGKYLRGAVESILGQTYRDIHLLIVDDASTDGALTGIQDLLQDKRIRIMTNPRNLGLAASLNRGLDEADCRYIVRMDGDDISHPKRIELQVDFMSNNKSCGMSGTWLKTFGMLRLSGVIKYPTSSDEIRTAQLFSSPVAHATLIMRKDMIDGVSLRYNPEYSRTEDFDLCTRATASFDVLNLPRVLYYYRRHPGCVTIRNEAEMRSQVLRIVRRQLVDLGVPVSDEQLDLHSRPCLGNGAAREAELILARDWMRELRKYLLDAVLVNEAAVNRVFGRQWYLFCRYSACLGRAAMKFWQQDKMAYAPTAYQRFGFGLACAVHEGRKRLSLKRTQPALSVTDHPIVSVLLPVHNGQRFVEESVASILSQRWGDLECLVVDDGSTDGTGAVLAKIQDPRLRIFRNEKPIGVAESLNLAIRESKGKYLARMDADDISLPGRISKQVQFMEDHRSVGVLGTHVGYIGRRGCALDLRPCSVEACRAFLLFGTPIVHPSVMIRKDIMTKYELWYSGDASRSEDYDLWIRLSRHADIANLKDKCLLYRLHSESVSAVHQDDMAAQQKKIIRALLTERGVAVDEGEFDSYCRVVSCRPAQTLEEMNVCARILKKTVNAASRDMPAIDEAVSIAWQRYCNNNMHLGIGAWKTMRSLGFGVKSGCVMNAKLIFLAGCVWNELRGRISRV